MSRFTLAILLTILQLTGTPFSLVAVDRIIPKSQMVNPKKSPIILDGKVLFPVQGLGAFSSEERAKLISERIRKVAEDPTIRTDSLRAIDSDISTDVVIGDKIILSVIDKDAAAMGRTRQDLANEYVQIIRTFVENYRVEYSRRNLLLAFLYTLIAAIIIIVLIALANRLFKKLQNLIDTRYKEKLHSIQIKKIEIVQVQRVRAFVDGSVKFLRLVIFLIIGYAFIHNVLRFYPWTRPIADQLLGFVLVPLKEIPNLLFIVVLVLITRFVLKFMQLFFAQIEQGTITFSGFFPEWAKPTYRILRFIVIAFAAVVVFPYVPGSSSPAFKGISIFIGVLFSLGSQSTISNILAGFTMTYRRLFKVGDRVKIGDIVGDVTGIRLQVTHLHTVKNEEVIVPNSTILNSNVTNYSSLSREKGLILYTTVTIGYDAPWRQVHALLLMAAEHTPGLLTEPVPFVLQKSLDDFYVTYELNVYTNTPQMMANLYSDLHKNIQDCFNEYGVQIMSPNYEADRAVPPIVPKERWFAPPAKAPENDNNG
jgi:small-conductance mechanosensitive channel